ncbi:lytic transglycosylase domain-containing protein [Paenibacillus psychroresistens]|nr:lytic transglycosylase domain-containing protein [Paenibacillus psychroresistens]
MSIDPRTLSQLLQLQILGKLNLSSDNSSIPSDDTLDSSFNDLLQSLLGQYAQTQPASSDPISTTSSLLASGNFGFYPPALSGPSSYDPLIEQASSQYGVDSSLIKAVVDAESSFQNHVVSSAGAKGLMQLMDDTARGLGVTDSFDPQQNIQAGTRYLSDLLRNYNGSESMALAAYNGGSGRLARLGITNEQQLNEKYGLLPQETQRYVQKVLQLKNNY